MSGALGAVVSNLATYPLNLIATRMQCQKKRDTDSRDRREEEDEEECRYKGILDAARKIYAREGLRGLYTGVVASTGKAVADSFLFFLAYAFLRQRRLNARSRAAGQGRKKTTLPVLDELAIGVLASAFARLLTTPLANITTRKQTAAMSSMSTREIASRIRAEKGLKGFWSGYTATLILTLNPSITFALNELLKCVLLPREKRQKPSAVITFLLAAISKAAASSVTYPISLAKTRMQANGSTREPRDKESLSSTRNSREIQKKMMKKQKKTILTTLLTIARTEGLSALYAGLGAELLKCFFSHGITMLTKDAVHALIIQTYYALLSLLRRYPGPSPRPNQSPSPEDLLVQMRKQAEELAKTANHLLEASGASGGEKTTPSGVAVAVYRTSPSSAGPAGPDNGHSDYDVMNEVTDLVTDYVERIDEAEELRSLYRWLIWGREK